MFGTAVVPRHRNGVTGSAILTPTDWYPSVSAIKAPGTIRPRRMQPFRSGLILPYLQWRSNASRPDLKRTVLGTFLNSQNIRMKCAIRMSKR